MNNFSTDSTKNNKRGFLKRVRHAENFTLDDYLRKYCGIQFETHDQLANRCIELYVENSMLKEIIEDFQKQANKVADMKIVGNSND